ncbi:MAG: tetratricopeptide repeat protein [Polyangiaceae bacterium]
MGLLVNTADAAEPSTTAPPQNASGSGNQSGASTSDNRAVAEMLFFTARGLMEAGRYTEACAKLAESYRLDTAAGTLLNLAVCHESEGRVASAWGEFRQALSDARKSNRADREELAKEHIAKLEPDLPFLTIVVPDAVKVKDFEILRNGVVLGSGGWGTELPIDPGKVEIVMRAPGYLPRTKIVSIQKKQHLSTTAEKLELAPIVETAQVETGWTGKRKAGAVLFIAGLAGAGVGTYFGFSALSNRDKSAANCDSLDGELRCTQAGADYSNKAMTAAWGANIGFGLGAVALVAGTYLFITGSRSERTEPGGSPTPSAKSQSPQVSFGVAPTAGGAQGAVFGSF